MRSPINTAGFDETFAEMYLVVAVVFMPGRFAFALYETTHSDVEIVLDFFVAFPRLESKDVRLLVN